jgi:hypothetical protein
MERRGFLRGLFGGLTSAGLLIAAEPQELAAFASPLGVDDPVVLDAAPVAPIVGEGDHLYNARGELVAVVRTLQHVFSGDMKIVADLVGAAHVSKSGVRLRG